MDSERYQLRVDPTAFMQASDKSEIRLDKNHNDPSASIHRGSLDLPKNDDFPTNTLEGIYYSERLETT